MYTVTFYSFKGGVGRTMALVNVAFELASRGRTVMMVDFDLEAPGLDAFLSSCGARISKGLVDFVTDYRVTGEPPDVTEYVYEVGSGSDPRALYMPAGKRGEGYGACLHAIDWRELYENEDGFLLFEDLKAQWEEKYQPDYVLLDSRTGHTDVGGICTRQLPDAVTLLFRLDGQNLQGLQKVVQEIEHERTGSRKKSIQLHYVPSNVPRIDDEYDVLKEQIRNFENTLGFSSTEVIIQHYEDLEMLKHSIYTLRRKNSRIAKEYAELTREIARHNAEDIEGAREYLRRAFEDPRSEPVEKLDERILKISAKHRHDHEILRLLTNIRQRQGKLSEVIAYLTEAINTGAANAEYLIRRAELYLRIGRIEKARIDLKSVLRTSVDSFFELVRLISLARQVDRSILKDLPGSEVVQSLSIEEKRFIAGDLLEESADNSIAIEILESILEVEGLDEDEKRKTQSMLALQLIGLGKFDEVIAYLEGSEAINDVFNLSMAYWGHNSVPRKDLFSRVIELHESGDPKFDLANYDFCIAISLWASNREDESLMKLGEARQRARDQIGQIFSPWRYGNVSVMEFLEDLDAAESMILEGNLVPGFVQKTLSKREKFNA